MKRNPTFSILIPTYKGSAVIRSTLDSILKQTFQDFEIIISEDCSNDDTDEVVRTYSDSRIRFYVNDTNLGYALNLEKARSYANGTYIFLMGQDDLLAVNALEITLKAFESDSDIGAVTRPYYWFDKEVFTPVRKKKRLGSDTDTILTMYSNPRSLITMFSTLDQLSGLSYRSSYFDVPFHKDIFPCHVYPFASIFKKHKIVFLKDYTVAVRISTSQTRHISSIYKKSPVMSWVELFETVYSGGMYKSFRKYMINNFVLKNYVGLVQIKNYAEYKYLLREIYYLARYRPSNLVNPVFWFFAIGTILVPSSILIRIVDSYKNDINPRFLGKVPFNYELN